MDGLINQEDLIYILIFAFYGTIAGIIALRWYQNKDKYLIRIKYATEKKMLVAPEGNEIILDKGKGRHPSWRVKFDMACLYFSKQNFGLSKRLTMDVMPDASEAIPYYKPLKDEKDIPKWTRKEHEEYANLDVLKALQKLGAQRTSPILWIIIVLVIVAIIVPLFLSGRF